MAENRIDSVIDIASVEAEIIKVEKQLAEMATTIKTFPKAQVFYDASGLKDLSAANKELSVAASQLRVKNLELTNAIKEQQLAEKALSVQRKQAIADAKEKAAAEKEAAKQAQIAGQERLRQLAAEKKAQEDVAAAEAKRSEDEEQALSGTFTAGSSAPKKSVEQFVPTNASDRLALSLIEDQRQLAATKEAQKLLSKEFADGKISQAEYDAQLVKSIQVQNDLKVSIANTTKELSLAAKANASIPGTIEDFQTRNAVLSKQASQVNVVNASPEEVAQLKSLNDEIDKNNELIRVNKDLLAQQKINIGNYPTALGQTFKTLNTELEQVQGKLVNGNFGGKEFDQLTAKQAVLQNALSLTGKTYKSSAAEATAYKEAAVQIGQVYGKDSSIFKQFAEGVKTGAANTKALANEVAGVAAKGKGFVSFLSAAWSGIRKLAYAIPGLGISGVILLLLGPLQAAGEALIKWSNNATKAGRDFQDLQEHIKNTNAVVEKSADSFAKATSEVSKLKEDVQLAKEGLLDQDKVLKEYNDTMGKTTGHLKSFDELEAKLVADGPDYINLLFLKAKATAAYALAGEAARKALTAQIDADKDFGATDFLSTNKLEILKEAFGFGDLGQAGKNAADQVKKNAEEIKKQQEKAFKDLQNQANDFESQAAALAKKHGWNFFDPDSTTKNAKKAVKDAERLLDEFRKKSLKEAQEYLKALDEAELKQYKLMADDQNLSLTERLDYEKKYYEKSLQMAKQNVQDQIDAVNLEASIATKKAGEIKDAKKKADTLTEIEDYRVTAIKRISEEGNAATLKINRDYYDENVQIATQAYDKINKIAEESAKFRQDQEKIAFQNQKDQIDIDKNDQLLALDKAFKSGQIKNLEEYNQRKDDIETAADIKQKQLDLKRIQDAERIIEAIYGVKNLNLIKQAKDLEVEIEEAGNKRILASQKELNEERKKFGQDLADFIETALLAGNQKQLDQLDKQSQDIDKRTQSEIDAINASTLAEEEKQKRITAAEKQASFEHEQIQKKQDALDKQRQTIQRLAAVAEVAAQIAQEVFSLTAKSAAARAEAFLLLANPLTAALAQAAFAASAAIQGQVPFVLASGALALVKAAAFKDGTNNAPKGPAIVGEEGSELVVDKSGKMYVTPSRPTLIDLAGGEKIFRHDITEDFLKHYNLLNILQKAQYSKQPQRIDNNFNEKIYRELRSLNGKPPFIIQVQNGMETTDYYMRNIKR